MLITRNCHLWFVFALKGKNKKETKITTSSVFELFFFFKLNCQANTFTEKNSQDPFLVFFSSKILVFKLATLNFYSWFCTQSKRQTKIRNLTTSSIFLQFFFFKLNYQANILDGHLKYPF